MKKYILLLIIPFIISCSDISSVSNVEEVLGEDNLEVYFYNDDTSFEPDISIAKSYIIENDNNFDSSSDIKIVKRAINFSNLTYNLFSDSNSYIEKLISRNGKKLITGKFETCEVIYQDIALTRCLLENKSQVENIEVGFIENMPVIYVSHKDSFRKTLFSYDVSLGVVKIHDSTSDNSIVSSFTGTDTFNLIKEKNNIKEITLYKISNGEVITKTDLMLSGSSLIHVGGKVIYQVSDYGVKNGWSKVTNDGSFSVNRFKFPSKDSNDFFKIGENVLFLDRFYTSDLQSNGLSYQYTRSSLFYLEKKRDNLPLSYSDYIPQQIKCCFRKNVQSGKVEHRDISWEHVKQFDGFVLAYGSPATEAYPGYYDYRIDTNKVVVIFGSSIFIYGDNTKPHGMQTLNISNNDDSLDEVDNKFVDMGFEKIDLIETYIRGFKISGTKDGVTIIKFYNPITQNYEYPNTEDSKTLDLRESL